MQAMQHGNRLGVRASLLMFVKSYQTILFPAATTVYCYCRHVCYPVFSTTTPRRPIDPEARLPWPRPDRPFHHNGRSFLVDQRG